MSEYAPGRQSHRAKKSMGQNFIADPTVCPRIAEKAGVGGKGVIEIGPGFGALTSELAKRAGKVVAVELDKDVIPGLTENLSEYDNVTVIEGDILQTDVKALIDEHFPGMNVAVVGNIPYNITSPLIMKLLSSGLPVDSVTVMIQKEPADRFLSQPGSEGCGAISSAVWYYGIPKKLFEVGPGAFRPRPKVRSSVITIELRREPAVKVKSEELFFSLIRAAFGQRRKTAANAISSGMGLQRALVAGALAECGLPEDIRAEKINLEDFGLLSDLLYDVVNTTLETKNDIIL